MGGIHISKNPLMPASSLTHDYLDEVPHISRLTYLISVTVSAKHSNAKQQRINQCLVIIHAYIARSDIRIWTFLAHFLVSEDKWMFGWEVFLRATVELQGNVTGRRLPCLGD